MTCISFTVPGEPVSQGSMSPGRNGAMYHAKKGRGKEGVLDWRERAQYFARMEMRKIGRNRKPWNCAVVVTLGAYSKSRPEFGLDLDKIERCVGDALEGPVITNDRRIVKWIPEKFQDKLRPRVEIVVETREG